jgi:hypothetical protein
VSLSIARLGVSAPRSSSTSRRAGARSRASTPRSCNCRC